MIDIFLERDVFPAALFPPSFPPLPTPRKELLAISRARVPANLPDISLRVTFIVFPPSSTPTQSFRPVNYTRQFVMLIHNYTLCTIAVRPPFRPTLRRIVLLSPTYIRYTGCSKHCVYVCVYTCERTCVDCAKIRDAFEMCVSRLIDM